MLRTLAVSLGATLLAFAALPFSAAQDAPAGANLVLVLPESQSFGLPDYAAKLEIDGKDFTKAVKGLEASVKVAPAKGKDSVRVVYTYWPYGYSKTVRTKVVVLPRGKVARANLTKEDPATPDLIFPIYVPTPQEVVDKMCEKARLTKDDVVCDIGCGDGRLVITAVKKFGARKGIGWDYDAERITECEANRKKEGLSRDRVLFEQKDALKLTEKDLSGITVVFLYVGEDLGEKLGPLLKRSLKPGARIISHRFPMGDWKPDVNEEVRAGASTVTLLTWYIGKPKGKGKD